MKRLLLAILFLLPAAGIAAVPGLISYQGRVLDSAGNPVGAGTPVNRTVIFRIWDHPSNTLEANLMYSEQQTVTIADGEFSVLVGQGTATTLESFGFAESGPPASIGDAFNGATRYLGVTVAANATIALTDNEITPRQQIVSSAFALRSKEAETLTGGTLTGGTLAGNIAATGATVTGGSFSGGTFSGGTLTGPIAAATATVTGGTFTGGTFAGNGAGLTSLNAANISSGTLADARLSSNVALLNRAQTFTGIQTINKEREGWVQTNGGRVIGSFVNPSYAGVGSYTSHTFMVFTNNNNGTLFVAPNGDPSNTGKVGINVASPGVTLDVSGSTYLGFGTATIYGPSSANYYSSGGALSDFTIRASGSILANLFTAKSDERIKNIEGVSDSVSDLSTLMQLRVTDYRLKDVAEHGNRPEKKLIAQQVREVYPQVVRKSIGVIPDVYQMAKIRGGWVTLDSDLKVGERVSLVPEKGSQGVFEVSEVKKDMFRVNSPPADGGVFVYGREVEDFLSVDYEGISMLNVSATQELARKVEKQETELSALRAELSELRKENKALSGTVTALKERDDDREARLAAIEQRLSSPVQPPVRTIRVKTVAAAE